MKLLTKLLGAYNRFGSTVYKKYSKLAARELEVPTFCDVYITVPYGVNIKPLNIHKYHNCDKLIIEHNGRSSPSLECNVNGNHVTIVDNTEDTSLDCNIKLPVKANIYVNSRKDITVGQLNGDKINLISEEGNITLDKFHGESVKITTKRGDINLKNVIQASKIQAITETGSISSGRLQGLNLHLRTNKGNLAVESSYCSKSLFEVQEGKMKLSNIHKNCKIILNDGQLNLNGFDGKLSTIIQKGCADMYLSRITKSSNINIGKGSLHLKLAELCQEQVKFVVRAKECNCAKDLKDIQYINDSIVINSDIGEEHLVTVDCSEGTVFMDCVSWQDMIRMKLKQ